MIECVNISKAYDGKILFDEFNLMIPQGDLISIHGESGSGKTTLLNIIGGLERPDAGTVIVNGMDIGKRKNLYRYYRDVVGFLFQNYALVENDTVRKNLEMIKRKQRKQSIEDALEKVGMLEAINQKVYRLSGGEQQRVAMARLMIKDCSIILADEPTGSLDRRNSQIIFDLLNNLNQQGKTIVIVSHDSFIHQNVRRTISLSQR